MGFIIKYSMDKRTFVVNRITTLEHNIRRNWPITKDRAEYQIWHQLNKMLDNCQKILSKMDRESVECRRLGKETTAYSDIYFELNEALDVLEQYTTVALLSI